ncbi:hypothetical protein HAZT_HAZT003589 [Hyalella azteca]|uniref:Uncharacterized protein n=1 Tax=Hyalella azteca TaxID=294128 RepID=A0A6A0H3Q7_HYAAZ|nr:hypothetical protein HAZT_HAZT003589 [Hyalella azteca]
MLKSHPHNERRASSAYVLTVSTYKVGARLVRLELESAASVRALIRSLLSICMHHVDSEEVAALYGVQKKRRRVARVSCVNIKNSCPEANCWNPVLLPGQCCKTCPEEAGVLPPQLQRDVAETQTGNG